MSAKILAPKRTTPIILATRRILYPNTHLLPDLHLIPGRHRLPAPCSSGRCVAFSGRCHALSGLRVALLRPLPRQLRLQLLSPISTLLAAAAALIQIHFVVYAARGTAASSPYCYPCRHLRPDTALPQAPTTPSPSAADHELAALLIPQIRPLPPTPRW